jgi:hypothetical protein
MPETVARKNDKDHPPIKPSLLLEAVPQVKMFHKDKDDSPAKPSPLLEAAPEVLSLFLVAFADVKMVTILLLSPHCYWRLFQRLRWRLSSCQAITTTGGCSRGKDGDYPPVKPSLLLEAVPEVKVETSSCQAITATGGCSRGKGGGYPPAKPSLLLEAVPEVKVETILLPSHHCYRRFQR